MRIVVLKQLHEAKIEVGDGISCLLSDLTIVIGSGNNDSDRRGEVLVVVTEAVCL